jgi:hypothetical protein
MEQNNNLNRMKNANNISKNGMCRFLKFIVLIVAVFLLQSFSNHNEKHIGEWKGEDGSLTLDKQNYVVFMIEDQVFGGESFIVEGQKGKCKYEIDYSKNPIWLDIVVYEVYEQAKEEEIGRFKGIVRFLSDTRMEYRLSFDGNRYDDFDPDDDEDTIILDKVTN